MGDGTATKAQIRTYTPQDLNLQQRTPEQLALSLSQEQLAQLQQGTIINCIYKSTSSPQEERRICIINKEHPKQRLYKTLAEEECLERIRQTPRDFVVVHNVTSMAIYLQEETIHYAHDKKVFGSQFHIARGNIICLPQKVLNNNSTRKGRLAQVSIEYPRQEGIETILDTLESVAATRTHTPYESLRERLDKM